MSDAEPVVRCVECHTVLAEPPNTPPEKRKSCPKCGSTGRIYAIALTASITLMPDMVIQAPAATARFEMPAPKVIIGKLTDASYDLQWLRLSEGGAWMVRVYDPTGDFVDGSIADDPAEALLAVAERLPP